MAGGRVLTALGEDPVWYTTPIWQFATAYNSTSRRYDTLFGSPQALHTLGAHGLKLAHIRHRNIYII